MQAPTASKQASLVAQLGGFLRYSMTQFGKDFMQTVEEQQLSLSQLKTLNVLALAREQLSLKELGDSLSLSLSATSRSVELLVKRGLVARTEDPDDRRIKRLALTPEGLELSERLIEIRMAGLEDFIATLTPEERERLAEAIGPIVERTDIAPFCRKEHG